MAEQSFQSHAHRPTHTAIVWLFAMVALVLWFRWPGGYAAGNWMMLFVILAIFELGWISRVYTVKLQDRIIMLEVKVRAAELPAGADAHLAKLSPKQIAAVRFAGDEEFGALLERAARENMEPKAIKAAIKTWRPDLHRT